MRIRSTKPEFWRSERIASVSWDARLVLKGLESYVDDNGVGKDDLALIVADVFPRDLSRNPPGTLQKVSEAITELHRGGLVWRYGHDGTNLIYVSFWESIQRIEKPTKGRFRRPDGTLLYRESEIGASFPEPSRNPPGTLRPGTGEQGNRGTGESLVPLRTDASPAQIAKNTTSRIVQAWTDAAPEGKPVPAKVVLDATAQVHAMVQQGIDPADIANGLREWWDGKYPASTLPNYVARAQQGPKLATGTNRARNTLEIVKQLEMEESGEPF